MGCKKLTYYDNREDTKAKNIFFAQGGLKKRYAEEKNRGNYYPGVYTERSRSGMQMPGRTFSSNQYRYGFNGKEKDPEGMGGGGTTYDYGFRIYNPQIAKFLSVDPLTSSYPWYTPYQFAGNKPIVAIDLDGLEEKIAILAQENDFKPVVFLQSDYTVDEWNSMKLNMMGLLKISDNFVGEDEYESNSQIDNCGNVTTPPETGSLTIYKNDAGYFSTYDETLLNIATPKPNPPKVEPRNPYLDNPKEFDFTDSWTVFKDSYEGKRFIKTTTNYVSLVTLPVSATASTGTKLWNIVNIVSTLDDVAGGISDDSFSDAHIDNEAIKLTINSVKLTGILKGNWNSVNSLFEVPKTVKQKTELVFNTWNMIYSPVKTTYKIKDMKENALNLDNNTNSNNSNTSNSTNSTIDNSNESR